MLTIDKIKTAVTKVGKKYGIKNAYLFGSYARGEANEDSDVDIIIDRGKMRGLIQLSGFRVDLSDELNSDVDVVTTIGIDPRFFNLIKNDRVLVYGA
ncbi:MAG: nucleotidyltransferase domain-containing protein [Candidatus Saccharibacteria bacterium]|nr:nucleotidyltransferase domain-containing protein [Candidatus Saccharibacteria bacterium]